MRQILPSAFIASQQDDRMEHDHKRMNMNINIRKCAELDSFVTDIDIDATLLISPASF